MRLIDLAGYATPVMVLLMTREMILRVSDLLGHVTGAIFSIAVCLLPSLSPHLMLLPMSARRLWDALTGPSRAESSQDAGGSSKQDRSRAVRRCANGG
ncbi:hypothetical protein [Bradyrhizobium sp.]|uniref:hypothetical protein n=1 Tax=Bradyrhizobium sp. TaxID=376 RepID=UPI002CC0419F|nr:hypothetical protein [Bradyrhizobium sp.]HMM90125.1 hypothetical protein [Bradyrhizobium sp.]